MIAWRENMRRALLDLNLEGWPTILAKCLQDRGNRHQEDIQRAGAIFAYKHFLGTLKFIFLSHLFI